MRVILCSLLITTMMASAQDGYEVKVKLSPLKNSVIYLGYHYGKLKALADSATLDNNSIAVFKGKEPLKGGIYFVVSPKKEILFEVLIDKDQHFSIDADTISLPESIKFSGSSDNTQFQDYSSFAANMGETIARLSDQFKQARSREDSSRLSAKIKAATSKMQQFRDSLSRRYPKSFLSALFSAMREPEVDEITSRSVGMDSTFAYRQYKSQYWEGVRFDDERLVRTPFFEPKLEKYYRELVSPHPDSIKREVDAMLLQARTSKEMFKFLMVHFVQKYINPQYMGQDAVFVHLFEKYINTGQTDFFAEKYMDFMTHRAYSIMANLIGQPAANLNMVDTSGKPMPLYSVEGEFIVLCFWDPTCGHCKEVVPKVDSLFQAKWRKQGVKVYAVKVDGSREEWIKFINEHNLKDWVHVYQLPSVQESDNAAGRPGYRQLYDVYQTPILYLLDKNKNIIAKKLSQYQIDEVISLKSGTSKSN